MCCVFSPARAVLTKLLSAESLFCLPIGICELKIIDKKKYKTITAMERDRSGKPAVKTIEKRCRAALNEYKAQAKKYKEDGRLLPFYPSESFYKE